MAAKHPLWKPSVEGHDCHLDARYQNTPKIVVQGDGFVARESSRYDRESPVSWVSSLTSSDGLEPAWSGEVQQDTGELFYVEPSYDPSSPRSLPNPHKASESYKGKKKKKSPLPIPNLMRKKKEQKPDNNTDQFKRTSLKRTSFLTKTGSIKEVCLRIDANRKKDGVSRTSKIETCLGIVGSGIPLASSVANGNKEHQNGGPVIYEGILVKGLLPSGSAMKSGEIDIGDCIVGVNGLRVFLNTIDKVLGALPNGALVKLQVQRLSYDSVDKYIVPPQRQPLNGTLIRSITGLQGSEVLVDPLKHVPHIILYLTLVTDESDDAKEVLYQYPETQVASKLCSVHGLFITLADMLQNITNSRIRSSSIVLGEELVHLGYHKFDSELLVVAVPGSKVPVFQLNCIVNNIVQLLCFMYKTLDSAFLDEHNHPRLHHLFGLLFHRLLLTDNLHHVNNNSNIFQEGLPGVRWLDLPEEVKIHIDCSLNELEAADFADMSDEHYDDRRPYVILGSCLFYKGYVIANHLPNEDLCDIAIYCLNFSLLVLCADQPVGQLVIWREVYPSRRQSQATESVPGYTEPTGRCFLLIVGIKHSLLCVLLEAGGCATYTEGKLPPDPFYVDQVRATLLHLETLSVPNTCENRLLCPPIPALTSADWFFPSRRSTSDTGTPPLPIQTSPMLSKLHSQSPLRGRHLFPTDPSLRRRGVSPSSVSQKNLRSASPNRPSLGSRNDSDNESDPSPFNSKSNSVTSSPAMGRKHSDVSTTSGGSSELYKVSRNQRLIADPSSMLQPSQGEVDVFYTATKLPAGSDNTLFHYVDVHMAQGVIATPTHSHVNMLQGAVHKKLLHNFHQCCITIKHILNQSRTKFGYFIVCFIRGYFYLGFQPVTYVTNVHILNQSTTKLRQDQATRTRRTNGLGRIKEHGVMFRCHPENWPEKKTPPSMNYWVVGRLIHEPQPRELYVCYHESAPQNVIQLAFKLSYGAGL